MLSQISLYFIQEKIMQNKRTVLFLFRILSVVISMFLIIWSPVENVQSVKPVLEFPEAGIDDLSTYKGYTTRFFKDSDGNTLQISLDQKSGRVVNLWADAVNESISFTARDETGQGAVFDWLSENAEISKNAQKRSVQYSLKTQSTILEIGHFILSTMRKERDFQHFQKHLQPFDSQPFIEAEFKELTASLKKLPQSVQSTQLSILKAKNLTELNSRLLPQITFSKNASHSIATIKQTTVDGKNHLWLELSVDNKSAVMELGEHKIKIRSSSKEPIRLNVKIGADSPSLHPLNSNEIFNDDFFQFYKRAQSDHDQVIKSSAGEQGALKSEKVVYFKRLERQLKSMELMCFKEKFFAGVPNYATYFGRDMMMSVLMLEPVLKPAMLEHVIASVLNKLKSNGEVSHEEGLGGQAIRENVAEYNRLIEKYMQDQKQENIVSEKSVMLSDSEVSSPGRKEDKAEVNSILLKAENILANLQKVTENYHMVDDDFQLPVLTALYLARQDVAQETKNNFLNAESSTSDKSSRLNLLVKNLIYMAQISHLYVQDPQTKNLISFRKLDQHHWHPGSWRDSGVGYANGRYAMDINTIWVPKALQSIKTIFNTFKEIGITFEHISAAVPDFQNSVLADYLKEPKKLNEAIKTWEEAIHHFEIELSAEEVDNRLKAKLKWFPEAEKSYWQNSVKKVAPKKINFLALSLDENGKPIPVVNTDLATWLFLENITEQIIDKKVDAEQIIEKLKIVMTPYPVGLFLKEVGPVVANDVYAAKKVWEDFEKDHYHSPKVIWGREVNLFLLGLTKQILASYDSNGKIKETVPPAYVHKLKSMLDKTIEAVEASGLKHNELWSYQIDGESIIPKRYARTTDIQLWNLTDLAVQYLNDRVTKLSIKETN